MLNWIFIVLDHWNNSLRIDICYTTRTHYPDSETTSIYSFLLNTACLAEKQLYQCTSPWFDPSGTRPHDLPHTNHNTADAVSVGKALGQIRDRAFFMYKIYHSVTLCMKIDFNPLNTIQYTLSQLAMNYLYRLSFKTVIERIYIIITWP